MAFPTYTAKQRREISAKLGIDEQYVYQILAGVKIPGAALARQFHELDSRVRLQDLRPQDWPLIWPELLGTDGAPAAREQEAA